jgi:hypothetical protein
MCIAKAKSRGPLIFSASQVPSQFVTYEEERKGHFGRQQLKGRKEISKQRSNKLSTSNSTVFLYSSDLLSPACPSSSQASSRLGKNSISD